MQQRSKIRFTPCFTPFLTPCLTPRFTPCFTPMEPGGQGAKYAQATAAFAYHRGEQAERWRTQFMSPARVDVAFNLVSDTSNARVLPVRNKHT